MVTVTDDGLERISDIFLGFVDDKAYRVAVGTGTGNEGKKANILNNRVYISNRDNDDCYFEETNATGGFRAHLEVTAGGSTASVSTSNPDENDITEIAVFTKQGVLIVIDEFQEVTIPNGHTEEFTIEGDITR